jgi:hypothetical protein
VDGLDRRAIGRGVVVAAVGASVSAAAAGAVDTGPLALLLLGAMFAAVFAGGWSAAAASMSGDVESGRPVTHGGVAGAGAFVVVQVLFSLATRTLPNPVSVVLALGLFTSLGSLGGLVLVRREAPEGRPPPR